MINGVKSSGDIKQTGNLLMPGGSASADEILSKLYHPGAVATLIQKTQSHSQIRKSHTIKK